MIIKKHIELLIENLKLKNMLKAFTGDFGDDNSILK